MVVRWHTQLLLLTLLPVGLGAQAQSSTEGPQVARPDTQVRGYWVDPSTGLMWAGRDSFGRDLNWRQALKYCLGLRLAGHADWRLPTVDELEGIYDKRANALGRGGKHNETPQHSHVKGDLFLTGDSCSGSQAIGRDGRPAPFAYRFDFVNGRRTMEPMYFRTGKRALCVRGAS